MSKKEVKIRVVAEGQEAIRQFESVGRSLDGVGVRTIKGKAIVSINDYPDIRRCFEDFQMEALKIVYTVGGGVHRAERQGLTICSWDRDAESVGLF